MAPVTRKAKPGAVTRRALSLSSAAAPAPAPIAYSAFDGASDPQPPSQAREMLHDTANAARSTAPFEPATALATTSAPVNPPFHHQDTLHPFREMAERVGREAETFAENLDAFLEHLPSSAAPATESLPATTQPLSRSDVFAGVVSLVNEFKNLARDAVAALERSHRHERAEQLRSEWAQNARLSTAVPSTNPTTTTTTTTTAATSDGLSEKPGARSLFDKSARSSLGGGVAAERKAEQVRLLRSWQAEADLWDLFGIVLAAHHDPAPAAETAAAHELARADLAPVHRYTPEAALWPRFLLDDAVARERDAVRAWLASAATHQRAGLLDAIVPELEAAAGRGRGLWSHGWMHTRERIKGAKRLRGGSATAGVGAGAGASDEPLLQIRRSDSQDLLVAALDPDAVTRQERGLEAADAYFERAAWMACWEMLRRGSDWEEVARWFEERNEGWRAISMGRTADPALTTSNAMWRKMCYLASQAGGANEYEAAVYGLLGGNVAAVQKVCHSVDDHLFAHYSTALVRQFDQYLALNYPERVSAPNRSPIAADASEDAQRHIMDLVKKLRTQSVTSTESVQPMKILESYLLANDLDSMIHALGCAIAYADNLRQGDKKVIVDLEKFWDHDGNLPEAEVAMDVQTLRIAAHICIILDALRSEPLSGQDKTAEENLLVAYIQALRAAGKRELIPLYASRLSTSRWVVVMSRVMQDITDPAELETTLRLMQSCRRDIIAALNESLKYSLEASFSQSPPQEQPLRMLEPADDMDLYPGQRIIAGFLPNHTTESDDMIVRSLQWYNMLGGHWHETFQAFTAALRKCLITGRLACALKIVREFPYENVSIRKSFQAIGKSVNMMDYEGPAPADERQRWEVMARQSRTYYELGLLVNAVEALAIWRDLEHQCTNRKKSKFMSTPPELRDELKVAKTAVDEAMLPVLSGILQHPIDESEDADLTLIRNTYIPEIIIAYNTVLYSAGPLITRHSLVESMDLSVTIANDDNNLSECFVKSGRMRELVTSFAHTSKAMLVLKAGGRAWTPKKDREGKDLGIWEIGPQSSQGGSSRQIAQSHN